MPPLMAHLKILLLPRTEWICLFQIARARGVLRLCVRAGRVRRFLFKRSVELHCMLVSCRATRLCRYKNRSVVLYPGLFGRPVEHSDISPILPGRGFYLYLLDDPFTRGPVSTLFAMAAGAVPTLTFWLVRPYALWPNFPL